MPRSFAALAGALLLAVGVALIAGEALPRAGPVAPLALPTASAAAPALPTVSPVSTAPVPAAAGPIPDGYRIRLPRLGIDLPIAEGDVERDVVVQQTPENFAFHLPGTAVPGEGGNTYLYAHARRGMFLTLWNARVGDEVFVSTPAGTALKYVVTEVHPRVSPDEASAVQGVARAPLLVRDGLIPVAVAAIETLPEATPEPTLAPRPPTKTSPPQLLPLPSLEPPPTAGIVLASWYGPGFYGNRTACGQTYTAEILGVAHRTLPCGTIVVLSYGANRVTVPVIDRGPYVVGRALDLSNATRRALGCPDLCTLSMRIGG